MLRFIIKRHCTVLEGKFLDETASKQVIKNIVYGALALQHAPVGKQHASQEQEEGEASQDEGEDQPQQSTATQHPPLWWLFRQVSYLAKNQGGVVRRQAALQLLAALSSKLGVQAVDDMLTFVIEPLFRVSAGKEVGYEANELKPLVSEVIELIEALVGTDRFYEVYNAVRDAAEANRKRRRADLASEAIANPEKHAQRKVAKSGARKRKAEKTKASKENGDVVPGKFKKKPKR